MHASSFHFVYETLPEIARNIYVQLPYGALIGTPHHQGLNAAENSDASSPPGMSLPDR